MIVATNVATSCDKCFYSSENIYNAKCGDNHACQGECQPMPSSSISNISVEPPGMPGCEHLPYPISAGR